MANRTNKKRKLTLEDRKLIRACYNVGLGVRKLGRAFSVRHRAIQYVLENPEKY